MIKENVIYQLRDLLKYQYSEILVEKFLEKAPKDVSGKPTYICPCCGSGSGANGTGLVWYDRDKRFSCFACSNGKGVERDIVDLYRVKYDVGFVQAVKELGVLIGYHVEDYIADEKIRKELTERLEKQYKLKYDEPKADLKENVVQGTNYYLDIAENAKKMQSKIDLLSNGQVLDYLCNERGLDNLNIERLQALNNIGYDDCNKGVMFICNKQKGATNTRLFTPISQIKALKSKGVQDSYFWNYESIKDNDVTFFTEGEIDALTIINHGFNAVSYGSCNSMGKLAERLNKEYSRNDNKFFVICPDNDERGIQSIKDFTEKYKGVNYFIARVPSFSFNGKLSKDINEFHQANKVECFKWLNVQVSYIADVKKTIADIKESISKQDVELNNITVHQDSLLKQILHENNSVHLSSKFKLLNDCLGGFNVGINLVGGGSGSGKTTVCMQMLEDFANQGHKCLVISTEMGERDIVSRSMARYGLEQRFKTKVTPILTNKQAREIVFDDKRNSEKQFLFNGYIEEVNNNLYVKDCENQWSVIKQEIINFSNCYPDKQHIVLIDFIQNLISDVDDTIERLRQILADLKVLAVQHNLIVFAISALNRAGQKSNDTELSALRDTTNLEYLAESVLFVESGEPLAYITTDKKNNKHVALHNEKTKQYEYKEEWLNLYTEDEYNKLSQNWLVSALLPDVTYTKVSLSIKKNRYGDNDKKVSYKFYKAFSCFSEVYPEELKEVFDYKKRTEKPEELKNQCTFSLEDFGIQDSNMCPKIKDDNFHIE